MNKRLGSKRNFLMLQIETELKTILQQNRDHQTQIIKRAMIQVVKNIFIVSIAAALAGACASSNVQVSKKTNIHLKDINL